MNRKLFKNIVSSFFMFFLFTIPVHAYLDPTIVTYTIQIIAGIGVGASIFLGNVIRKILGKSIEKNKLIESQEIIFNDPEKKKKHKKLNRKNMISEQCGRSEYSCLFYIVSVCLCFAFLLGIFSPLETYFANAAEISFGLGLLFPSAVKLFFIILFILGVFLGVIYLTKKGILPYFGIGVFAIYLILYIQGTFFNKNLPHLDGTLPDWSAYGMDHLISIVIIVLVCVLAGVLIKKYSAERVSKACGVIALCMVLVQSITLIHLKRNSIETQSKDMAVTSQNLYLMSKDKNYIILLVDAVDSASFQKMMNSTDPQFRTILEDFTYYPDTVSVYPYTTVSVPYILSGELFLNEKEFSDYVNDALDQSPLFKTMEENNYDMGLYDDSLVYESEGKNRFENIVAQEKDFTSFSDFAKAELEYFWFRYAPYPVKRFANVTQEQFQDILKTSEDTELFSWKNSVILDSLKENEVSFTDNKCFKFIHIQGAHKPFEYDSHANIIDKEKGSYEQNIEACFFTVNAYLQKLKEAGVYDNSVIMILADHGFETASGMPELARGNAFLAIKGIHEKHPLTISDKEISYTDLQEAYQDLFTDKQSKDLFKDIENDGRKRKFIFYSYKDEDHMFEYTQYGHAWDYKMMVYSGNTYFKEGEEE